MFLTTEILEQLKACDAGIQWFSQNYPNGGSPLDIAKSGKIDASFLHWAFDNLELTEEEKQYYKTIMLIDDKSVLSTIKYSSNIKCSSHILRSSEISDSIYIADSIDIVQSSVVGKSKKIINSQQIYDCYNVSNSQKIIYSNNIKKSYNIVSSSNIVDSNSILYGEQVFDSFAVYGTKEYLAKNIRNSAFIAKSSGLEFCMFCANLQNKRYYLFNKPINEEDYLKIKTELDLFLQKFESNYLEHWYEVGEMPWRPPKLLLQKFHYQKLSDEFWEWVQTLPGYRPELLYRITLNPFFRTF